MGKMKQYYMDEETMKAEEAQAWEGFEQYRAETAESELHLLQIQYEELKRAYELLDGELRAVRVTLDNVLRDPQYCARQALWGGYESQGNH